VGDGRDIGKPLHIGEVVRKHTGAKGIYLALPGDARWDAGFDERGEQSDFEPGDAAVKRTYSECRSVSLIASWGVHLQNSDMLPQ
jgi:hypothetical protein